MKRNTTELTKFILLSQAVGGKMIAAGALEMLWHLTAREARQGNIGKIPNERIALAIGWKGNPEKLISPLVKYGWLDEHPVHRLLVHDWHDHADDSVRKQLQRAGLPFLTSGERPRGDGGISKVYFFQTGSSGNIKIGFTEGDITMRVKALQTGNGQTLHVLGWIQGTRKDEADWHKRWASLSAGGEWFRPEADLLAAITGVCQRQPTAASGSRPAGGNGSGSGSGSEFPIPIDAGARGVVAVASETPPAIPVWFRDEAISRLVAAFPVSNSHPSRGKVRQALHALGGAIGARFATEAEAEVFLFQRVSAYSGSPLCRTTPQMYRPSMTRWLVEEMYDNPDSAWATKYQGENAKSSGGASVLSAADTSARMRADEQRVAENADAPKRVRPRMLNGQ